MSRNLRIGTRESQLAVWQASLVQKMLKSNGVNSELVYIKSEGDVDTVTPLYELGVQGIFTKTLDVALLSERIDIAVHSMKDVPTVPAKGIVQAAVLQRASHKDILVFKDREKINTWQLSGVDAPKNITGTIATSSIRRIAQWLHRYPLHSVENLRGNVNTRLQKLSQSNWDGAIFAAAGLERIGLRSENSFDLDWMLPAPAQGAIVIVARQEDEQAYSICHMLNDRNSEICTRIEREFLRALAGGCSTPISALATISNDTINFEGNVTAPDGSDQVTIQKSMRVEDAETLGIDAGSELLSKAGGEIGSMIRKKLTN